MQEYAEPSALPPATGNLTDRLLDSERTAADQPAVSVVDGEGWRNLTCAEFAQQVRELAKGIVANGVQVGDRVGIMSRTRYEWTLVDYAIWYAGAVSVPIYDTSSAEQVAWNLSDSGAVAVFLESDRHKEVLEQVAQDLPRVTGVWVMDDGALDDLRASGHEIGDDELERRRTSASPDDIATIIYTSGTTGRPKGCVLTHANLMFAGDIVMASAPQVFAPGQSSLLFLPLAHSFGRQIGVACVRARIRLGHTPDVHDLLHDLGSFAPTFLLAVPRVFEKVYNGAQAKATAEGRGRIFDAATRVAIDYSTALDDPRGPGLMLRLKHYVFDRLVYAKLRAAMGGNVEYAVSGGAPLGERLGHYFRGIGVTILEGYGLTESMAGSTMNRPDALRIGTVGKPFPGTAVRITDDGEVLLKGPNIFRGYWNNEEATAEVLEPDGWLHTGDIGELDPDGFLRITGRKKELIVTAGGKNVAPSVLEDRLRAHALVSQCMVVGDAKPFVACLVTLDADSLPAWLKQQGRPAETPITELVEDPALLAEIQAGIDDANKAVSKAESIRKFKVLPIDWTEAEGQITPSLKLKRNVVMAEFADEVESLYR
ncbi:MAG TPA: long-chain fatty acid--CoA ligase [Actinomycetota bacterium]|nr:long-chain fatty acid--CoA ligase [Actinomycetota bacterium]